MVSPRHRDEVRIEGETVRADVTDFRRMGELLQGSDAVIHCAALMSPSLLDPDEVFLNNVQGACSIAVGAERSGVSKLVSISSLGTDGREAVGVMHRAYLEAKETGEVATRTLFRQEIVVLRPGWVMGPDKETRDRVYPSGGVQVIVGSASVPVIWLWDLAEVIVRSLQLTESGVYTVTAGQPCQRSFFEYAKTLNPGGLRVIDARRVSRLRNISAIRGSSIGQEFPDWRRVRDLPSRWAQSSFWGFQLKCWRECLAATFEP